MLIVSWFVKKYEIKWLVFFLQTKKVTLIWIQKINFNLYDISCLFLTNILLGSIYVIYVNKFLK